MSLRYLYLFKTKWDSQIVTNNSTSSTNFSQFFQLLVHFYKYMGLVSGLIPILVSVHPLYCYITALFGHLAYWDPHEECGHLLMTNTNAFFVFFLHGSAYQSCFGPLERLWPCVRAERQWTHRVGVFSIYINLQIGHSSSKCPSSLAFIRGVSDLSRRLCP